MLRLIFIILSFVFTFQVSDAFRGGLRDAMEVSTSGLRAQTKRISVISQNIANAESTGSVPGAQPYRRKVIFLSFAKDRKTNLDVVKVKKIGRDPSDYKVKFDPHHPAANDQGYVLYPNVDRTLENMDAREAGRSYEANMTMYEISKNMEMRTLDILR